MAVVSAEIVAPYPDRQLEGILTISTDFGASSSADGKQSHDDVMISRTIEKSIRRSNAIDTESLCIVAGEKVWSVRADIHLLDDDGGLIDASCIAVIAGLAHFRRPDLHVEGSRVHVFSVYERVPVPLAILHWPMSVSFSFFGKDALTVVDANKEEQGLRSGYAIISVNRHKEVCQITKAGGVPVNAASFMRCVSIAYEKATKLSRELSLALEKDQKIGITAHHNETDAQNER